MNGHAAGESIDDRKRTTPRCAGPDMWIEVLSPCVDFNDKNKQPAIICDFFSRELCIEGSYCRFLHIRDNVINQQPEGHVSPKKKRQLYLQHDEAGLTAWHSLHGATHDRINLPNHDLFSLPSLFALFLTL